MRIGKWQASLLTFVEVFQTEKFKNDKVTHSGEENFNV